MQPRQVKKDKLIKTKKPKSGKPLEDLVASIERTLACNDNASIQSPAYLIDRITGKKREHDVLITIRMGYHEMLIAIECRDRSRKITVNDVEGFVSKCADTGVNRGVIVSPKGFSSTALIKAKHLGISCLEIEEVKLFNWLHVTEIQVKKRNIKKINWEFFTDKSLSESTEFTIFTLQGNPVEISTLNIIANDEFQKIPSEKTPSGLDNIVLKIMPDWFLQVTATGQKYTIAYALVTYEYECTEDSIPFQLVKYSKSQNSEDITDAAVAEISLENMSGRVVILRKEAEEGRLVYIPDSQ